MQTAAGNGDTGDVGDGVGAEAEAMDMYAGAGPRDLDDGGNPDDSINPIKCSQPINARKVCSYIKPDKLFIMLRNGDSVWQIILLISF